eukprot:5313419-Pleurochrysis_carterae.AAC.1
MVSSAFSWREVRDGSLTALLRIRIVWPATATVRRCDGLLFVRAQAAEDGAQYARDKKWNELAFWHVHAALTAALRDPESDRATFTRLCNRHELQLVLMTSQEMAGLTQAQMQAWGTSGLQPLELRAVLHALQRTPVSGKPAAQFIKQLSGRMRELPPPLELEAQPTAAPREDAAVADDAAANADLHENYIL